VRCLAIIVFCAFSFFAFGTAGSGWADQEASLSLKGIQVVPHVYSEELRYFHKVDPEKGCLVRLVVECSPSAPHSSQAAEPRFTFNGKDAAHWLQQGAWTWYEMPENKTSQAKPYRMSPGSVDVFSFNASSSEWGVGENFELGILDARTGRKDLHTVSLQPGEVQLSSVVLLSTHEESIHPEEVLCHVVNGSNRRIRLSGLRLYAPSPAGGLLPLDPLPTRVEGFMEEDWIPKRDRGGAVFSCGPLPLTRGLLELRVEDKKKRGRSLWAALRFKRDRFDIGAGWLAIPVKPGHVPIATESYLRLLQRMHVNCAHAEVVPGYNDDCGPGSLCERYPMQLMSGFADVERFNRDEWVARIHGVDILGEPQMGRSPMESFEALQAYDRARYPTTITLSKDAGFRYYAGLSDFPHFDAYRVVAPSSDAWIRYDRWDGERLCWGAPLEGIGEMTRTLLHLGRPLPIALWSQSVHHNWSGFPSVERKVPTGGEIELQAYEGLANGAKSLYWYSLESWSLLEYRWAIDVTTRLGREMRVLEDLLLRGDPYHHERRYRDDKPHWDLNGIACPNAALLFAMDLSYRPNRQKHVFEWDSPRLLEARYPLPGYLRKVGDVFRVDADGIEDVEWRAVRKGVAVRCEMDKTAVFAAAPSGDLREELRSRWKDLMEYEASVGFDPAQNEADYLQLREPLGLGPS